MSAFRRVANLRLPVRLPVILQSIRWSGEGASGQFEDCGRVITGSGLESQWRALLAPRATQSPQRHPSVHSGRLADFITTPSAGTAVLRCSFKRTTDGFFASVRMCPERGFLIGWQSITLAAVTPLTVNLSAMSQRNMTRWLRADGRAPERAFSNSGRVHFREKS